VIRVLVCDDSETARRLVVAALRSDPGIEVVGTASNGRDAVEMARLLRPDLITMDVRMPVLDGLRATEEIMREHPTPIVIVSSSVQAPDLQITFNALRAGALEVVEKPRGGGLRSGLAVWQKRLVRTVRAMAEVRVVRRRPQTVVPGITDVPAPKLKPHQRLRVVAVGASTGGPQILSHVFRRLPPEYGLPILCVQHMVPGFIDGFARWLAGETHLRVQVAEHDQPVHPGCVHVAPDGAHLRLGADFRLQLGGEPPRGMFRPSVDVLFESVAQVARGHALGILLSGMGNDGAHGLLALRKAGGLTFVQKPETCVVPGMPLAARELGAAEDECHPDGLAEALLNAPPG
jgi:two-component system chemotaxis response regulator CheB